MKEFSRYALAYALWAVSVVVAGAVGLIGRDVLSSGLSISAASAAGTSKSADFYLGLQLRAAEPWTYIVFGILLIILIAFLDNYYRGGVVQERLLPRFLLVTAVEIGILTLAHISRFVFGVILGTVSWTSVALPVIEAVVTGIFVWLYRRLSAQPALIK
jgi:hypothetical protein